MGAQQGRCGVAVPVCEKTANILSRAPYGGHFVISDPLASEAEKIPFDCSGSGDRSGVPEEIARRMERFTGLASNNSCDPASGCC